MRKKVVEASQREYILREVMARTRAIHILSHTTNQSLSRRIGMSTCWVSKRTANRHALSNTRHLTATQEETLILLGRSRACLKACFDVNLLAERLDITCTHVHMIASGRRWGDTSREPVRRLRRDIAKKMLESPIEEFIERLDEEKRVAIAVTLILSRRLDRHLYETLITPITDPCSPRRF